MSRDYQHLPSRPLAEANLRYRLETPSRPAPPAPRNVLQQRFLRTQQRRILERSASRTVSQPGQNVNTEPKQKLGDLFGLIVRLLKGQEYKLTVQLVEHLGTCIPADAELSCTQSVFRHQLATFLHKQASEASETAVDVIQQVLTAKAQASGTRTAAAIHSSRPAHSSSSRGSSLFDDRQRRSHSGSITFISSHRTDERSADAASTSSRASRRHGEASDRERPAFRRSRGSYDLSALEADRATIPISSRFDHDGGGDRKHEARRRGHVASFREQVDGTRAPSPDSVRHDGVCPDGPKANEREGHP